MKVLLRKNVSKLGKIGELVEVKVGYARNFLLPHRIAVEPTKANLKAVEAEKAKYLAEMAARKAEFQLRADAMKDKEVTIAARANAEGQLYGSVGPAQIVAALAAENIFVDEENVEMDTAIRRLDKYDVNVVFSDEVKTVVHVWVVPIREEGEEPSEAVDVAAPDEGQARQDTAKDEESPAQE